MSDGSAHPGASAVAARFDVFLSHNSRDKPAVARLALKLKREAIEPWFDAWSMTPGGRWQEELADGLARSTACAVFIGPHDIGAWGREELAVASNRAAVDRSFRLFLVLLPGVAEQFDADALSPFLSTRTWVDLRGGLDGPRGIQALINAVRGIPLGPDVPIEPRPGICPYRGLRPFEEDDDEFFFGRDADVQRLLEKLKSSSFLAVLGSSGSGKSSLVRAGVVPAVRRGAVRDSGEWRIVTLKPGAQPLDVLAGLVSAEGLGGDPAATRDALARDPRTLRLLCAAREQRTLWVVDQFEEVFSLCRDEAQRSLFVDNLLHAATGDGPCVVILTLRADFYPRCAAHPELALQVAAHQALVSAMDPDGLRQAIEEPAARVGLEFEPGLVDTMLEDVSAQPGALPLLEHALLELWGRRRGRVMTLEGYRESGGVDGAVAKRAEALFAGFTPEQQAIARRAFLRLTQPGEGTEDTRRRAQVAELVTTDGERDALDEVVRALVSSRMLTAGVEGGGDGWVDVSHEALIRGWPRLRGWLDEDRAGRRIHRRITESTQEWLSHGRDDAVLYRGVRLAEAREWAARDAAALNEHEREFLAAGATLAERERRERDEQAARERELGDTRRRARRLRVGFVVGVCLAATVPLLARARPDLAVENSLVDARMQIRGPAAPSGQVMVVAIDDRTLRKLGGWPLRRRLHGRLIDRLHAAGARVIAYDIQFTEVSDPRDDNALVTATNRARDVVLATTGSPPAVPFGGAVGRAKVGVTDVSEDSDGSIRHVRSGADAPGFAVATAALALGHPVRPADRGGDWIDYPWRPADVPEVSFVDVLRGHYPARAFRGKIVVIGGTAPDLQDIHPTPLGAMSGVASQAAMVDTILRGFPLRSPARWLDLLVVAVVGILTPVLLLRLSPSRALLAALAVAALYVVVAQIAFSHGVVLSLLHPLVALLLSAVAALALELRRPPGRRPRVG